MATIRELVTLLGFDLKDAPLKEYERKIQSAKKKTEGLSSTMKGVGTAIKWIGGAVAAAGFAALGKSILDTTGEVEQYRVTLGTMIGDQEKANKIIHDLDYSPVSDFYGTAAAIGGLQGMVTFGMQAEEASETLTRLGDIAQGNGEAFKSLSLNMGQVFAKGKADATDLKQFVGQGFDVVGEISKMTGKSRAEIEKTGVSYEQCAAALKHITNEGGKYNGMLAKQSQTLPGLIKQFQSLTAAIKESIGTAVLDNVKKVMQYFLQLGRSMQDNIAAVGTKVFDTVIRGVVDVIEFFEILIIRMKKFGGAFTPIKALISDVFGFFGSVIESAYPFLMNLAQMILLAFKPIQAFVQPILEALKGVFDEVFKFGAAAIGQLLPVVNSLTPAFKKVDEFFARFFEKCIPIIENLNAAFKTLVKPIEALLIPIFESLWEVVSAVFTTIGNTFDRFLTDAEKGTAGLASFFESLTPIFEKVGKVLGEVIGSIIPVFEGVIGFIGSALQEVGRIFESVFGIFINLFNSLQDEISSVGGMFQTFGQLVKNVFGALEIVLHNIIGAVIPIVEAVGNMLIPVVKSLWDICQSVFGQLVEIIRNFAGQLADSTSGLGALAQTLGPIFATIGEVIGTVLSKLKPVFSSIFNLVGNLLNLIMKVFKIVVSVVQKIIPILQPIISFVGRIIGFVFDVVGGILSFVIDVVTKIVDAVGWIVDAISNAGDAISKVVTVVGNFFKKIGQTIAGFFTKAWAAIKKTAVAAFNAIKKTAQEALEKIKSAWVTIKGFFTRLWNSIVENTRKIWNAIADFFAALIEKIKTIWNKITEFFSWLWNGIINTAKAVWNGILDFFAAFIEKIKSAWNAITSFFSSLWNGIVSVAKTIWEGIVGVFTSVIEKIKAVWNGITGFFSGLWEALKNSPSEALDYIKNAFFGMFDSIKRKFTGFIDNIKEGWEKVKGFFSGIWDAGVELVTGGSGDKSDKPSKVNDLIVTPDGTYSTHPDDYIMAMKNPSGIFDTLANLLQSAIVPATLSGSTASLAAQRAVNYDNSRYSSTQSFNTPITVTVNASGMTAEQARFAVEGGVRNALREAIAGSRGVIPSPESWRS